MGHGGHFFLYFFPVEGWRFTQRLPHVTIHPHNPYLISRYTAVPASEAPLEAPQLLCCRLRGVERDLALQRHEDERQREWVEARRLANLREIAQ